MGIGLGLRWEFLETVLERDRLEVDFFEVSPENYMRRGGYYPAMLERVAERYPILTHGLTMSLGATEPPDPEYLAELRCEVVRLKSPWHSDHLCFSTAGPRCLHELLPLKHSSENVERVVERVLSVQDTLGVPMAIENISYYAHPGRPEMPEPEFIGRILEKSRVGLLLDVNNVYVNAQNHGVDSQRFIEQLPLSSVVQIHVAGHTKVDDLIIDTHGAPVIDPVYELLAFTLERTGPVPVLLERDHHIPDLDELLAEIRKLRSIYERCAVSRRPDPGAVLEEQSSSA